MSMEILDNSSVNVNTILDILQRVGGVQDLSPDKDFYDAGVTSLMALPLLLELETQFGVTIPDDRFITARTARDLQQLVAGLKQN